MKSGAAFWLQRTAWAPLRAAWEAAGRAGFDSMWAEDHLLADVGDWRWPKFEGWATLAALAPLTPSARVGTLVTAVAFRNPGHVAKLATTLDHITDGRFVLGMGAGHFQREHEAFGLDFGVTPGARLDRLDEALGLIRRLLDGEEVTHHGRYYDFVDALCEPRPVQERLPILIGGTGPNRTMRMVARHADEWSGFGSPEVVAESITVLTDRCAEIGRDPSTIKKSVMIWAHVRDSKDAAYDAHRTARTAGNLPLTRDDGSPIVPLCAGTPQDVADGVRAYERIGIDELIWQFLNPFDLETIERLAEVRAALDR